MIVEAQIASGGATSAFWDGGLSHVEGSKNSMLEYKLQ